ncbi:hypothetical protein [Nostoc sp.]
MGKKLPMPHALCPKRRSGYPSPPTLGMEFPAAFNELPLRAGIFIIK